MTLALIPLALSILKELPGLVLVAEAAFSGKPGSGAAKKEMVQMLAQAGLNLYQGVSGQQLSADAVKALMATVSAVTDAIVTAFNAVQVFRAPMPAPAKA